MPRQAFAADAAASGPPDQRVFGLLRRTDRGADDTPATGGDGRPAAVVARAFARVAADLDQFAVRLTESGQQEAGQIIGASAHIAHDPELRRLVDDAVSEGTAAEEAIAAAAEHFAQLLEDLPDPTLAARAADVRAVGRRLVAASRGDYATDQGVAGPLILVAREVTADDLLTHAAGAAGAATVIGGATSHAAIVARSLGVPLLLGADPRVLDAPDGVPVLLDAGRALVIMHPNADERGAAAAAAVAAEARRGQLRAMRTLPVSTRDGRDVSVLANVASAADAEAAAAMDAPGVGLVRTEMPFLAAHRWPTLDEHLAALRPMARPLRGMPVTFRTLDYAEDKLPPFLRDRRTGGPDRSLARMLVEPDAFARQLEAIVRVGTEHALDVQIMFPMVASVAEYAACRGLVAETATRVGAPAPPVGAMIELTEAVAAIDAIAERADFLSIGSNDLAASVLGLDRRDPELTPARVFDAPVLDALSAVLRAGARVGCPVSICGDAASDPALVAGLIEAGCRILSVAPSMMDEIRAAVRAL